jgi:hypothetical protein
MCEPDSSSGPQAKVFGSTPFEASCVYPYLFETAPGGEGGILAGYDRVPNPFVLAPPWDGGRVVPQGGEAGLRLTLIGRAVEHAGFARQAVVEAGLRGLGPDRGALDLASVEPLTPPPIGPCPDRIEIALASPLRLVEAGRLVGPAALRPRHLLLALLRRVSTLAERHGALAVDARRILDPVAVRVDAGKAPEEQAHAQIIEAKARGVGRVVEGVRLRLVIEGYDRVPGEAFIG